MHKLTIEDDEGKTVVVPLIRDEITVGRQEGNSIRLTERNISRRHARFYRQSGTLFVEDLGSYNGIKVNGTKIAAATGLKDGDLVIVGDYKLTVRADRPTATRLYAGGAPFQNAPGAAGGTAPLPGPVSLQSGGATAGSASPSLAPTAPLPLQPPAAAPVPTVTPIRPGPPPRRQRPMPRWTPRPPSLCARWPSRVWVEGAPPARLVAVSTGLAGTEFSLDRPSLVIGRTPENDIVLNHKSISRHHAKIIRDGDKYIVVDLESANGVRVNGSEFERVELQTGDTVELGHVKLKFSTGNDYIDFDVASSGGGRRKMIIGGAVTAVALAGVVLAFSGGRKKPEPAVTTTAATEAILGLARSCRPHARAGSRPRGAGDAGPGQGGDGERELGGGVRGREARPAIRPHVGRGGQPARHGGLRGAGVRTFHPPETGGGRQELRGSTDAVPDHPREQRVPAAGGSLERGGTEQAGFPEPDRGRAPGRAQPVRRRPHGGGTRDGAGAGQRPGAHRDREVRCARGQGSRQAEAARGNGGRQGSRGDGPPAGGGRQAGRARGRQPQPSARAERRAAAAAATPAPAAATPTTQDIRPPQPRTVAAATAERATSTPRPAERPAPTAARAEARNPAPTPRPTAAARTPPPAAAPAAAAETGDPDALIQEAQQSWLRGQYAAAIETSRKALRIRPNTVRAYQIIAVCSCSLRDADSAAKAYERLEDRMKPLVKSACSKNGINLQ